MKTLDWLDDPAVDRGIHFARDIPEEPWTFLSYADLATAVLKVAHLLSRRGLRRGGVVPIVISESMDFLVAFYGVLAAGGTASPLAPPLTFRSTEAYTNHLADVLAAADPAVILVEPRLVGLVEQSAARLEADPPVVSFSIADLQGTDVGMRVACAEHVLLQFTSGSSGTPKGVQVSADNLDVNTFATRQVLDLRADDTVVSWLPPHHDMGLIGSLLTPIRVANDIRLLKPSHFVRSPLRWLQCLGRDGGTTTLSPSFGFSYAARRIKPADLDGLDFTNWRTAMVAAERTDAAGIADFISFAQPHGFLPETLFVAYGLAEATLVVSATPPRRRVPILQLTEAALRDGEAVNVTRRALLGDPGAQLGHWVTACGVPIIQTAINIVDDNGAPLPDGHHGQIQVVGDSVAQNYKGAPHTMTSTSFDGKTLNTGDTGFILDGQLYVVGRMGDSIKVRGLRLYAEDIDIAIRQAGGLNAGRCVALLGSAGGADVVAAVVECEETDWVAPVRAAISARVSGNIVVALFQGEKGCIERTSSGKPRRRAMWRRLLDGELPVHLVHTNGATAWRDKASHLGLGKLLASPAENRPLTPLPS